MQLHLPIWQPPPYYFAPIWSLLYILMGISLAIIWIKNLPFKTKKTIYILFVIQLVFNFMWAILFFKYHLIVIALVDILLLINTLFMMMFFLSKISKVAAWLLLPYLAWVAFATYLNITIWILN
jgi:translocator protein